MESEKSDLFLALKRRHACRSFDPSKAVPEDVLQKLVYAAHRAPTGGGAPYRFLIVVRDPIQLKMLKMLSPGLFSDPPVVLVICSRTKIGNDPLPKMDLDECCHIDAGACAENIALTAYALGLGACFVKSYSEIGMARLLELPPDSRTELMVSVGYPAGDELPPLKKDRSDKLTYQEHYGPLMFQRSGKEGIE
ncbi:MAG TPA: nitroreductase family protein [Nitrososphaerales archaeon]|nr:nitroreductase family protein [Nitrososphaerales archaeon]